MCDDISVIIRCPTKKSAGLVMFNNYEKASTALKLMRFIIEDGGYATLGDLYFLSGHPVESSMRDYRWDDLSGASIAQKDKKYYLLLPHFV